MRRPESVTLAWTEVHATFRLSTLSSQLFHHSPQSVRQAVRVVGIARVVGTGGGVPFLRDWAGIRVPVSATAQRCVPSSRYNATPEEWETKAA